MRRRAFLQMAAVAAAAAWLRRAFGGVSVQKAAGGAGLTMISRRSDLGRVAAARIVNLKGRNAWVVRGARVSREGSPAFALGTYDGRIACFGWDGRLLWEHEAKAFPFDLACRDVDGDGIDEVFAALADGRLLSLSATGKVRFEFRGPPGIAFLPGRGRQVVPGGNRRGRGGCRRRRLLPER
jgi:hypothetical protein